MNTVQVCQPRVPFGRAGRCVPTGAGVSVCVEGVAGVTVAAVAPWEVHAALGARPHSHATLVHIYRTHTHTHTHTHTGKHYTHTHTGKHYTHTHIHTSTHTFTDIIFTLMAGYEG